MRFLKENRNLFFLLLFLVPAFYFDKAVMSWIKEQCTFRNADWYEPVDYLIKFLSHGATLIISSLLVFLGARHFNKRRLSNAGKTLFAGMITAGITVQGFKHLIGRARPRVTFDTVFIGPSMNFDYDALPSGHTTLAFCLAYIISQYYPRFRPHAYFFAIITGMDRVLSRSHFPSDVLAGAVLGTAVAILIMPYFLPGDETLSLDSKAS